MLRKRFCLTPLIAIFALSGISAQVLHSYKLQDSLRSSWSLGVRAQYGFIIDHHPEMEVFTNRHFSVYQVEISRSTTGKKAWQEQYNYPYIGFSYLHSDLGGSDILGGVDAFYPFIDFPLMPKGKDGFVLRFGAGLSWFDKCFDRIENYKNSAMGSHLNSVVDFELMYVSQLVHGWRLKGGLAFTHFSNGSSRMPNYGINVLTAGMSVTYNIIGKEEQYVTGVAPEEKKKGRFEYYFSAWAGQKEIAPVDGLQYLQVQGNINALYYYRETRKLGLALDVVYDDSDVELLKRQGEVLDYRYEYIKPGLSAVHEWQISRFSIGLRLGIYLYQKEDSNGSFYDVVSLNYLVGRHFLLNLNLKSHFAKADCVGVGLGFKL